MLCVDVMCLCCHFLGGNKSEDYAELSRLMLDPFRSQNLRLPTIYTFLPYLLNDPLSTVPAFVSGQGKMHGNCFLLRRHHHLSFITRSYLTITKSSHH